MEQQPRNTVVSVRLDDLSLEAIDLLVRSGLAASRSEAAAQFITIGIRSGEALLREAQLLASQVQRIRQEMLGAVKSLDIARVKALLDEDSSLVDTQAEDGETALLTAVYHGAQEITDLLLARGAQLSLYEAAALGETDRLRELLAAEPARLNSFSHDGWTPLHLAAFFGHEATVAFLLSLGADQGLISQNRMANLALHAALAGRRGEATRLLVAAGSDLSVADSAGWTALHHAAFNGDLALVQLLLHHGALVATVNQKGQSPAALAREKGHLEVAKLIEERAV